MAGLLSLRRSATSPPSLRLGVFASLRLIPSPAQSARGLAQSKTLRAVRWSSATRQRLGVRWPSTAFPPRTKPAPNFKRPLPPRLNSKKLPERETFRQFYFKVTRAFSAGPLAQVVELRGQGFRQMIAKFRVVCGHILNFLFPAGAIQ